MEGYLTSSTLPPRTPSQGIEVTRWLPNLTSCHHEARQPTPAPANAHEEGNQLSVYGVFSPFCFLAWDFEPGDTSCSTWEVFRQGHTLPDLSYH